MVDHAAQTNQQANTPTMAILAFSATAGVLVEFYDFFIYGYAAASASTGAPTPLAHTVSPRLRWNEQRYQERGGL